MSNILKQRRPHARAAAAKRKGRQSTPWSAPNGRWSSAARQHMTSSSRWPGAAACRPCSPSSPPAPTPIWAA